MISAFFTADYRDGRVIFGGKSYPAGVFATHLLNQFYINDTAAWIAVFSLVYCLSIYCFCCNKQEQALVLGLIRRKKNEP